MQPTINIENLHIAQLNEAKNQVHYNQNPECKNCVNFLEAIVDELRKIRESIDTTHPNGS